MSSLPPAVLAEALSAVAIRVRWYERRGYKVPPSAIVALNHLTQLSGVTATQARSK